MDSTLIVLELLAIFILILANGFFAASEFALIAARKSRIKSWVKKGNKKAVRTQKLLQRPDRFLAAIQVGITFVATLAGVFGGATLVQALIPVFKQVPIDVISNAPEPVAIAVIVIVITFLSVVVGELIPKYLALANPESIALRVTRPIALFSRLAFFLVGFLSFFARLILKIFGFSKTPERSYITEEEINIMISEGIEKGAFDRTEQKLIKSVFDFTDITVRQSMTPRVDIIGIRLDWKKEKILDIMTTTGFSRYPVYEDFIDEIVGVVYAKDIISMVTVGGPLILRDIIRKPLFIPDSMPLTVLLRKFQKRKIHIALVLDEFGGTAGLITLEDILEEIVGDIQDEHDYMQPEFVAHSGKIAFAAGSLRPDELNDQFGTNLPEDEYDTLAGYMIEKLGHVPDLAEELTVKKLRFKVLEIDGSRIKRIRIEKI